MSHIEPLPADLQLDGDTVTVAFEQPYANDARDLWGAVTGTEQLQAWFAPVEGDLHEGGTFTIHFDDGDVPECRVASCQEPERFSFVWPVGDADTEVVVELSGEGQDGHVHLTHHGLPRSAAAGYAAGWDTYLRTLREYLAGAATDSVWEESFDSLHQAYRERVDAL